MCVSRTAFQVWALLKLLFDINNIYMCVSVNNFDRLQHFVASLALDADSGSISAHALAKAELERLYDNIFACGASLSLDVLPASDHASSANLPPSPTHDASSASTTTGAAGSFISGISSTTAAASDNADVATNRFETSSASFGAYVHPGKANVSQSSPGSWRFPLHNMLARPQDFKPQIYYEVKKGVKGGNSW
jgi:hypothetical protein